VISGVEQQTSIEQAPVAVPCGSLDDGDDGSGDRSNQMS
jgi:hypothetical protein